MNRTLLHYLGHSTFRIVTESGKTILLDPFIEGNPQCPLKLEQIREADMILVTHGAQDHMGQAVELALATGATLVSGPDVRVHAISRGVPEAQTRVLAWGGEIEVMGVRIRSLKADHLSFFKSGDGYLSSIAMSFLITTPAGLSIYAMGDSSIFQDLQLFGQLYRPQVGLMPVGGFPGFFTEISPREAALAASWLGLNLAVPVHYTADPENGERFREICAALVPQMEVEVMAPGDSLGLVPQSTQVVERIPAGEGRDG